MTDSPIASGDYVVQQPVAAPQLTPTPGTFVSSVTVTISCTTPGASIYYTTNGVDPDTSATLYTGPVTLTTTTVLKAIAGEAGMTDSPVVGGTYTILQPVAGPTFAPPAGTYQGGVP